MNFEIFYFRISIDDLVTYMCYVISYFWVLVYFSLVDYNLQYESNQPWKTFINQ